MSQSNKELFLKYEKWKPIKKYKGYFISNLGRVKSFLDNKKEGKILKILYLKGTKNNIYNIKKKPYIYSCVNLYYNGDKSMMQCKVHQLVARAFIKNPKRYRDILFKDGNRRNCKSNNLKFTSHTYYFHPKK